MQKLKSFALECQRVLKVTKKPTGEEFKNIVKISGLGALVLGAIGFILFIIKEILV
ncbi:MAG: protein translocase SEC61 complex subunit gamma [archaeon]